MRSTEVAKPGESEAEEVSMMVEFKRVEGFEKYAVEFLKKKGSVGLFYKKAKELAIGMSVCNDTALEVD